MEDEYGYIFLNELSDIELDLTKQGFGKLQVRQQENFHPVPLKKLYDSWLQEFFCKEWVNECENESESNNKMTCLIRHGPGRSQTVGLV